MRGIPDCLNRRYRELDELVNELSSSMSDRRSNLDIPGQDSQDPEIKLMCDFWNILKESPDCNLPQAVHQRMCTTEESCTSCCIPAQHFTCYNMARATKKPRMVCCHDYESEPASGHASPVSATPDDNAESPINKVLGHLKLAAAFDKKCTERLNNLLTTENLLKAQIEVLETKEKEGVMLLKKADCMWSSMDDTYKERIDKSNERQKILLKQLKEIEASVSKWRKNKKDLESQLDTLNKQEIQVKDKINQKKNDIKYLDMEIEGFKKRIEGNKKETTGTKNSLSNKKKASDAKIATITTRVKKLEADLKEERKRKQERDNEGATYIKEAREELLKICRILLQKKLENEDKIAEKEGILLELNLLQETSKKCKEKCKNKQLTIGDEINKIDAEIAAFKIRCFQCHECVDTSDIRKFCTDCPKCACDRECIDEGDHCDTDHSSDCVCQMVKRKFLDNVFDNMYTVLERQSKTGPGKAVADVVMNCLKKSRNGKLNEETRKILQDFVLTTVKNNLNLTIVGGAVKTRCEMDAETYKQLMLCLKQVKATRPPKADVGTNAKKDACRRWGGTSECNCPKGPKNCICSRKAPPPPNDPAPCPPPPQDKEDAGEKVQCPIKKDTACGVDCGMHLPSSISTEVVKWRADPCQGPSCKFEKNMRAAQCILGSETLSTVTTQSYKSALPDMSFFDSQASCKCDASSSKKPCSCCGDLVSWPRERIIDEVMGRYTELPPIEKVSSTQELGRIETKKGKNKQRCVCSNIPFGEFFRSNTFENGSSNLRASSKKKSAEEKHSGSSHKDGRKSSSNENGYSKSQDTNRKESRLLISEHGSAQRMVKNLKKKDSIFSIKMYDGIKSDIVLPEWEPNITVKDLVTDIISKCILDTKKTNFTSKEHKSDQFFETYNIEIKLSDSTINEYEISNDTYGKNKHATSSKGRKNVINKSKKNVTRINNNNSIVIENVSVHRMVRMQKMDETVIEVQTSEESLIKDDKSLYRPVLTVPLNNEEGEHFENNDNSLLNYNYLYQRIKKIQQDSKQLKAEKSVECYKDICPVNWEKWSDISPNVKLAVSDVNTEFYASDVQSAKIDKTEVPIDQNVKKPEGKVGYSSSMPNIMREEISGFISDKSTVPITLFFNNTDMLTNYSSSKVEFSDIVSLTHTASGEYIIELDAKTISQINQKSTKDPVMFVGIKETVSGQRKLVLNHPSNMTLIRTLVKKTPSGSISLEVDKSMAKKLFPSNERNVDFEDGKSSATIGLTQSRNTQIKTRERNEQLGFYNKNEYGNTTEHSGSSCNRTTIKSDSKYYTTAPEKFKNKQQLSFDKDTEVVGTEPTFQPSSKIQQNLDFSLSDVVNSDNEDQELKKIYNEHTGSIKMRIQGENGVLGFIKADVTKTSSGNVALDLINVSSIGEISSKNTNHPVLLKRSSLGTYTLFVARRRNIKAPNAVLRRTSSDRVLVIMTPIIKSMSRSNIVSHIAGTKPKLFKIRTKGNMCGNILLQKAVLKLTPSGNYILVLDKEFEIQHTNAIQKVLGMESESYVELSKMDSETVVINFERSNDQNAVLVKSPSGHLKVYVNGPIFENLFKRISNVHPVKQKSFEELLLKPLARETKKLDDCTKYDIKYDSDTNLNKKIRIKFQLRDGLFAAPSATLKRTPSGGYAVFLSEESKKRFGNDLKNFSAHSSHNRIPIKTTDDGEITIVLNGESESKGQYGLLKITPSGNIYVLVQESVLQEITKNSNKYFGLPDVRSEHLIKKNVVTENKCVATNCNAEPDDGLCDASKCVCEKIKDKPKTMFYSGKEELKLLKKKCGISLKTNSSIDRCSTPRKRNVSPHIVIKPCNFNTGEIDQNRNKQCYYVFDSVCPLHKKTRYDTVSNEILEISGMCKNVKNRDSGDSSGENLDKPDTHCESLQESSKCIDWDSLIFLPPQLPPFLKHYSYRKTPSLSMGFDKF